MTEEKQPLISVLMGVYNCKSQAMLFQAVRSIQAQTYTNWELILCDDGSTNPTLQWLQQLAEQDTRIRLLQNQGNRGLAVTLNRCLAVAKGAYLARQDDDDYSDPERFAKQVAFLQAHPEIDFVGTNCALYTPEQGICGTWMRTAFPEKQDFLFNSPFIHGSVLFRRRCFEKVTGYPIMRKIARYEDYMLFMQLYAAGLHGANLQEPLYTFYFDTAIRRIPVKERWDEAVVRWKGFRQLHLLPVGFPYVCKPLLLATIPPRVLHRLRQKTHVGGAY